MEKKVLLLFLMLFLLTSCGGDKPIIDDNIYQYVTIWEDGVTVASENGNSSYGSTKVLSRFNTQTGMVTPLCPDPLCRHVKEDDCPFTDVDSIHIYNGMIYFTRSYFDYTLTPAANITIICSYDLKTSNTTVLHEFESGGGTRGFMYNRYVCTINDGDGNTIKFYLDLESGEVVTVAKDYEFPNFEYDGRLYYYEENDATGYLTDYYSTKEDGSDKKVLFSADCIASVFTDAFDGRYFIWGEYGQKTVDGKEVLNTDHVILHRYDMKKDVDAIINENFSDSYFAQYDGKLYYAKIVDNPPLLGVNANDGGERYNQSGGIIWEFDPETCEESIFLELSAYTLQRTGIERVGETIVIDYTNIDYSQALDPDGDGWYEHPTEYGKIVINMATGEYSIYTLPEFH